MQRLNGAIVRNCRGGMGNTARNVKRWRDGQMALRAALT
jgi:hypothetical protein